jgi:hypothetical protein
MAKQREQVPLRISPWLMAELKRWAGAEVRSLNAQIEFLLTEAVRRRGVTIPRGEEPSGEPPEHPAAAEPPSTPNPPTTGTP